MAVRACIVSLLCLAAGQTAQSDYKIDLEKAEIGKVPDDIMVLDGRFAVREVDGNKCLELAADPIGAFGALFGPDGLTAVDVKARIQAAPTGKRFPEFGIGAGGAGGYKLMLVPRGHAVELRKGDDAKAAAAFDWSPRSWTWFRLRVAPNDKTTWTIQGKVWRQGQDEPSDWTINAQDAQPPPAGKASIWGNDYSEQPMRFDDLSVSAIEQK